MKKRLIILNSIVMLIALVIVLLVSSIAIVNVGQNNTEERLNNYLALITNIVEEEGYEPAYNAVSKSDFEIRLTIIDLEGNVLYDTQMSELENHLDREEIKKFPYRPRLVLDGVGEIPALKNKTSESPAAGAKTGSCN